MMEQLRVKAKRLMLVYLIASVMLAACTVPTDECVVRGICSVGTPACSADGWCWENPLPHGQTLNGVWVSSSRDVWAVGDAGIVHWDGEVWSAVNPPGLGSLRGLTGIWGDDAGNLWIIGLNGTLIRYVVTKEGPVWRSEMVPSLGTTSLYGIWGSGSGDNAIIYMVGENFGAQRTKTIWTTRNFDDTQMRGTWFQIPNNDPKSGLYIVVGIGKVYVSLGSTFSMAVEKLTMNAVWNSVWGIIREVKPNMYAYEAWVVGANGQSGSIIHYQDGVWSSEEVPARAGALVHVWGRSEDDVWAVGDRGTILHRDGTKKWLIVSNSTGEQLDGIGGQVNDAQTWVVGHRGTALRLQEISGFEPSGNNILPLGTDRDLFALWGSGPRDVWAAGAAGALVRWDGTRWIPWASGTTEDLYTVWGSGPDDVWVGGQHGTARRWDGRQWRATETGTAATIRSMSGAGPEDLWAIAGGGKDILHWDGERWSLAGTNLTGRGFGATAVWVDPSESPWVTYANGSVFKYDRARMAWTEKLLQTRTMSTTLLGIWGSSDENVWVIGKARRIYHYKNGTPSLEHDENNQTLGLHSMWGTRESAGEEAWAVGEGSILHRSYGPWNVEESGAESIADLYAVWGSDPNNVWAVGSHGTILHRRR